MENKKLIRKLQRATDRECKDDHLTTEERVDLINEFKANYPEVVLPNDVDEAFVEMISEYGGF